MMTLAYRSLLSSALAALSVAFTLAAGLPARAQEKSMLLYEVTGTGFDGSPYTGKAVITRSDAGCKIRWRTPDLAIGNCMVTSDGLVAYYRIGKQTGLAAYKLEGKDRLSGIWSVDGDAGRGTEILTLVGPVTNERLALLGKTEPQPNVTPPPDSTGNLAKSAVDMLVNFLDPNADLVALTAAMRPTAEEIRAVYKEPLASRLIAEYDASWKPGTTIGPKPGQNQVLVDMTNTKLLRSGSPDAKSIMPGGYSSVVSSLNDGYPIGRFKFVKKGETLGLSFDGLIYINDRWILIPKPWRSMGN